MQKKCLDRCGICGQRYHCDLQKNQNYVDFFSVLNVIFRILKNKYLT